MTEALSRAEIMIWRKTQRKRMIAERLAIDPRTRQQYASAIIAALTHLIEAPERSIVSLYWPFRGEPDLRPWMKTLESAGVRCALPVVVAKATPLAFRLWRAGDPLVSGVWNIPVPERGEEVVPDIVMAPVVGFDSGFFRLGYGGGFFDRTLAGLPVRPLAVGVGFAQFRLETVHPLPHDIAMDIIVTEREVMRRHRVRPRES